jgi:Fuc2NAc and GlcNAc transferase
MTAAMVLVGVALLSSILTGKVRSYARRRSILDVPNHRSLHGRAVPRGGGLAFVATGLLGLPALWFLFPADATLWMALLGSLPVALAGWLDDRRSLSPTVRFLVHGLAGGWAVVALGGLSTVRAGPLELHLGVAGYLVAWLFVVWLINLYNFMDGIDGLAAGQAVLVGTVAAILAALAGKPALAWSAALVAAGCAGFLRWNLPPALVFMGDVGSGFLGYVFAVLALYSETAGGPPLLAWLLLLGVFLVDATATLFRRMLAGEQWYQAHRSHAYQRAVQLGYSHRFVTASVLSMTLVLGAAASLVNARAELALPAALVQFGLLFLIWRHVVSRPLRSDTAGGPGEPNRPSS